MIQELKRCSKKEQCIHPESREGWLPASVDFFRFRQDRGVFVTECLHCERAYRNAWKKSNPQKVSAQNQRWRKKHPELKREIDRNWAYRNPENKRAKQHRGRALKLKVTGAFSGDDIKLLYRSQKGLCWWCSKPVGSSYHIDHRVPLSRGGTNAPENLCITCPSCNVRKHDKLPHEWNGRLL